MEIDVNLQGFTNLLLAPHKLITLEPKELVAGGRVIILAPRSGNKELDYQFIEKSSLPYISLREAGINHEQPQRKVFQEVRELLKDRLFVLEPKFNFLRYFYAMQYLRIAVECMEIKLQLQQSPWLLQKKPRKTPEEEFDEFLAQYQIEFSIHLKGGTINGLNTERNIQGFVLEVMSFIMPPKSYWEKDVTVVAAIGAAFNFFGAQKEVLKIEESYQAYLKRYSHKWWFSWWNSKKEWESELANAKTIAVKNQTELKSLLLDLQCN